MKSGQYDRFFQSEPYVLKSPSVNDFDFFASKQRIGVKRGLFRPKPLCLCSSAFRKMAKDEKLSGFAFARANVEKSPEFGDLNET